jgi:hypothetical protein
MKLDSFPRLKLAYVPGKLNPVADALSRNPLHLSVITLSVLEESVRLAPTQPVRPLKAIAAQAYLDMILRQQAEADAGMRALNAAVDAAVQVHQLHLCALAVSHTPDSTLYAEIMGTYSQDPVACQALADLATGAEPVGRAKWELHGGLLFYREGRRELRLYVPAPGGIPPSAQALRQRIIAEHHDVPFSGHLGRDKTYEVVSRRFFWHKLSDHIYSYVRSCDTCQRTKGRNHPPYGLARPLPVPERPSEQVGIDFIPRLPRTQHGKDCIVVFTDHLTKMCHFVATTVTLTAEQLARLYAHHVFRLHGFPTAIVSDRDRKFTGDFWRALCQLLGTKLRMSTACHPQTDGQTERANRRSLANRR